MPCGTRTIPKPLWCIRNRKMKIYSTLHIGEFHTLHCEDFFVVEQIESDVKMIAVLDGCTMGTESVFSSILFGKILRNIAKKRYYQEFVSKSSKDLKVILKEVLNELFEETKTIKNQLGLDKNELLSTLIIGVINKKTSAAEFLTVGDGLIHYDGNFIEYEQDNTPDYLGYHLNENFENWFDSQEQVLSLKTFHDLAICTDGIFTFKNLENSESQKDESQLITHLLVEQEHSQHENMLDRKVRFIKDQWKHTVTDDLAIIRIITTPQHGI